MYAVLVTYGARRQCFGRFAATPPSCPAQASVPSAPTSRAAQREGCSDVCPNWSTWLRVQCARPPFGAFAAILVSILTNREATQTLGPAPSPRKVLILGRASDGEERVGPRHARRARPHASCARLRVAPVPILRIAFHAVRLLPGLVEQHPRGTTQAWGQRNLGM